MFKIGDEILWRLPKNQWQNGWRARWWVASFPVSSLTPTMKGKQLLFSWAAANPWTKLFLDSNRSIASQLQTFHVWCNWSRAVVNEFDAKFWGTYDRNSSEFENVMTWGQHLVECSVYYKQAPSRPLSQGLSPPHLPPPERSGRDGKEERPREGVSLRNLHRAAFIWCLHRQSKT